MGLCLVAAFAISAAVVASASASLPQFEVKGKKGLEPLKKADAFTGKGGVALLRSGGPTIECTENTSKGSLTGPKSAAKIQVTYTGCGIPSLKVTCQTNAKKPGEIKTEKIKGTLVYTEEAPGKTVGTLFEPEGAASFVKFKCGTIEVNVTGSVIGEAQPTNTLSTSGKTILAEKAIEEKEGTKGCGKQQWLHVEGKGPCHFLEALGGPSWNIAEEELTYKVAVQVTA
jgi:hypothetical protein